MSHSLIYFCLIKFKVIAEQLFYSYNYLVCQANITTNIPGCKKKVYLGVPETTFNVCYGNHKKSFTKQYHKNDMELSEEYWKVKQQNEIPRIKWKY